MYKMQSVAVAKIKVREGALVKKAKDTNKSVKNMKLVVQEVELLKNKWEENH